MIIHSKLSKMENKILSTCLQENYRNSLGEFSNTSYGVFSVANETGSCLEKYSLKCLSFLFVCFFKKLIRDSRAESVFRLGMFHFL